MPAIRHLYASASMSSDASVEAAIRAFIGETFPLGEDVATLAADASLLDAGILDSTAVLELVDFVETRFGVTVGDDDLLPENFDTIEALGAFVEERRDGRG
jgi:acyl carrier protein